MPSGFTTTPMFNRPVGGDSIHSFDAGNSNERGRGSIHPIQHLRDIKNEMEYVSHRINDEQVLHHIDHAYENISIAIQLLDEEFYATQLRDSDERDRRYDVEYDGNDIEGKDMNELDLI